MSSKLIFAEIFKYSSSNKLHMKRAMLVIVILYIFLIVYSSNGIALKGSGANNEVDKYVNTDGTPKKGAIGSATDAELAKTYDLADKVGRSKLMKALKDAKKRFRAKFANPTEVELTSGHKIIVSGNVDIAPDETVTADYMEYKGQKYTNVIGAKFEASGKLSYQSAKLIQNERNGQRNSIFDTIDGIVDTALDGSIERIEATSAREDNTILLGNNIYNIGEGGRFVADFSDKGLTLESDAPSHFESLDSGEQVDIDGTNTVINYENGVGISCVNLGTAARYTYAEDVFYDPFAIYIPPPADPFML